MGLCREVTTGEETFSDDGDSSKSPPEMACDCTNIVGRDHLKTKRAKKFQSSKRIQHLAQPKYYTRKYVEEETSQGKAAVEIIRTYEEQTPVRIKLLAYPQVRRLVASRNAYKGIIDKQWYGRFEDLIRRAMLTMYSRMANVQLPDKIQRANWTRADWQKHCEWLKKRALPKMEKLPSPCKPKKVPLNNLMASMFVLSQPRHPRPKYVSRCGYLSTVKFSAQRYEPTERILKLAEPKQLKKDEDEPAFEPFHVNPNALSYQPSERIKKLATPRAIPEPTVDDDLTPHGVLKRALKATTNERTVELSKPKEKAGDDQDDEEKPLVNPKALKAKPTPRIIKLAEPRPPIAEKYKFNDK